MTRDPSLRTHAERRAANVCIDEPIKGPLHDTPVAGGRCDVCWMKKKRGQRLGYHAGRHRFSKAPRSATP